MKKLTLNALFLLGFAAITVMSFVSLSAAKWANVAEFNEKAASILDNAQVELDRVLANLDLPENNTPETVRTLLRSINLPASPVATEMIHVNKSPDNRNLRLKLIKILKTVRNIVKKVSDKQLAAAFVGQFFLEKELNSFMKIFIHKSVENIPYIRLLHERAIADIKAVFEQGKALKAATVAEEKAARDAAAAEDQAVPVVAAE